MFTLLTAPFVWLYSTLSEKSLAHTHSKQQARGKKKIDRQHLRFCTHASCPAGPPHPSAATAPRREALHPLGRPLLSHLPPQSTCVLPYPVSTRPRSRPAPRHPAPPPHPNAPNPAPPCSPPYLVPSHNRDSRRHGSGTGRTERHHVRPAEAAFRAHLGKPGETFGKFVANV